MKRLIKISATLLVLFFVAGNISAQEHKTMHKAQKSMMKMDVKKMDKNNDGSVYQCPMCPDQISDKPGDCPKCRMHMKKVSVQDAEKAMTEAMKKKGEMHMHKGKGMHHEMNMQKDMHMHKGQMHMKKGEMEMHKHGMKTGKNLDLKKYDKNGDGYVYECPMQCGEPSDKPGECHKCGMKLEKVKVK